MARAKISKNIDGSKQLIIKCPGCGYPHAPTVKVGTYKTSAWSWNGSLDKPTISPSLLVTTPEVPDHPNIPATRCHSFIKDGRIQFLNDCTHKLAGQTVDLPEIQ